jgi:hypothetical protein
MSSPKREVQCVDTGTIFESLISAAKWAGIKSSRITAGARYVSRGGSPSYNIVGDYRGGDRVGAAAKKGGRAGGYKWKFVTGGSGRRSDAANWAESDYTPPIIPLDDRTYYNSGRSWTGSHHLRKWVVLSKEKDGKVQCCVDKNWYPTMLVQVAHIRPFKECDEQDRYHRDSSLPMSMSMHKLYDFNRFTILADGTIKVLDKDLWKDLTDLDGQSVLGWREQNARFVRDNQVYPNAA